MLVVEVLAGAVVVVPVVEVLVGAVAVVLAVPLVDVSVGAVKLAVEVEVTDVLLVVGITVVVNGTVLVVESELVGKETDATVGVVPVGCVVTTVPVGAT